MLLAWRPARTGRRAIFPAHFAVLLQAGHAASAKDSMVTSVRQKQQELLKEVAKMQASF